jgi:nitrate reductase NapE component
MSTPPPVEKRYPILRFLVVLYKVVGVLVVAGGFLVGLYQMLANGRMGVFGIIAGLGTMIPSLFAGGICWMVAEGVGVFLSMEENTRQAALSVAQAAATMPLKTERERMAAALALAIRLLEQMDMNQQQTNQRLDALVTGLNEVRGGVGAGVRAVESIAESSKVTATVLYRSGGKPI